MFDQKLLAQICYGKIYLIYIKLVYLIFLKGGEVLKWLGLISIIILLYYSSYPGKIKNLESKLKKLEKNMRREKSMSKILTELKDKKCILVSDECLLIDSKRELQCTVLDVDDEWIKFSFVDKKGSVKSHIFRIESIERVELIE